MVFLCKTTREHFRIFSYLNMNMLLHIYVDEDKIYKSF